MNKILSGLFCTLLLFLAYACRNTATAPTRPMDPWVFRSVLDQSARMITIALHKDMFAAYNTQTAALYKVWRGGVDLEGAVYTTHHGPQPTSFGKAFMVNKYDRPWTLTGGGTTDSLTVHYKGHRFEAGRMSLLYELAAPDRTVIAVEESPEYVLNKLGQQGFERKFTIKNVPAGRKLQFATNVSSVADVNSLEAKGALLKVGERTVHSTQGFEYVDVAATLEMGNGENTFTTYFIKNPTIENPNDTAFAKTEITAEDIMASSDCATCHNPTQKTVGPSFAQIADRYEKTPANIDMLATKIIKGGVGVWGQQAMTAHPNISKEQAEKLVAYILAHKSGKLPSGKTDDTAKPDKLWLNSVAGINNDDLYPGVLVNVYQYAKNPEVIANLSTKGAPLYAGISSQLSYTAADMKGLESNFAIISEGYLSIEKDNNFVFRLISDDGSRLTINDKIIVDNDGLHGMDGKDGEVALSKGLHKIKIEYFNGAGGKGLSVQWRSFDNPELTDIHPKHLLHNKKQQIGLENKTLPITGTVKIPGDAFPLAAVHPSYDIAQARPAVFAPKVGGMDFLPNGDLVVCTWDKDGAVYVVKNATSGDEKKMKATMIANGLAEPLGLKVVDGDIYVLQKQELTLLKDTDKDGKIDEYRTVSNAWRVSPNFHEFAFGLVYKDGYFYATLATAILPGGASARPQIPDRGKVVRIAKKDGTTDFIAQGLRTPNGIGIGVDNEIFVADNQGDWLPACKILHVKPNAFFGSYSVDSLGTAKLPVQQPVVWLPQDEIGNSATQPVLMKDGPYKGQMLHGDLTNGGIKRVFVEKVNGEYQGCVFHFTAGLEAGINRMVWGPDGNLYVGGIGSTGNWQDYGRLWYGLQRLSYNKKTTFEPLAMRAKSNGIEIEFTEPIKEGREGYAPADYEVKQWWYKPTIEYGGPKMDEENLAVKSVTVSDDRKKVFLELNGMKPAHVVYVRIANPLISESNQELWITEGYYTLNNIPQNENGIVINAATEFPHNTLTKAEAQAGWKLLFDGKSFGHIHNFKKKSIGSGWIIDDQAIHLNAQKREDGGWQVADGGDIIITDKEYQNYELRLEWKIGNCGNSGIIYNVIDDPKYDYVWQTGPEMQILDNACHPDAKIEKHRAGDLYDLIASKYETVKPAGQWNKVLLRMKDGNVEHWLNGRKVVATTLWTKKWDDMVKGSKFKDMPGFGTGRKGHISLQDHGDKVWFRNIKIRELK